MAITTPQKDWQAGNPLAAADLDTYLSANMKAVIDANMPSGVRTQWLPAAWFRLVRGTPAEGVVGSGGLELRMNSWALDAAAIEAVTHTLYTDFDPALGNVTAEIYWAPTSTNTGAVAWQLLVSDIAAGEQIDQATDETESHTQAANGTLEALHVTNALTINRTGRLWRIAVQRNATDAGDTFTGDASFLGVLLKFTPT